MRQSTRGTRCRYAWPKLVDGACTTQVGFRMNKHIPTSIIAVMRMMMHVTTIIVIVITIIIIATSIKMMIIITMRC